jgi:hypothetical protein
MCNNTKLCFFHVQVIPDHGGKNKIYIYDDHECKIGAMTSQELLRHLRNVGDFTHTAISIYLETLNTFSVEVMLDRILV